MSAATSTSYVITAPVYYLETNEEVHGTFRFRRLVLLIDGGTPYKQHVCFEVSGAALQVLDRVLPGQLVTVHYNLRGREFVGRDGRKLWPVNLRAWKVEPNVQAQGPES